MTTKFQKKSDRLNYIISNLELFKKPVSSVFIHNIDNPARNELIKSLKNIGEIIIPCLQVSTKNQIIYTLGTYCGLNGTDSIDMKISAFDEMQFKEKKLLVFDQAEYLHSMRNKATMHFIEDLYVKGSPLLFISSHPMFKSIFKHWDLYTKHLSIAYDFNEM